MKLNVGTKLVGGFALVIALAAFVAVFTLSVASRTNEATRSIYGNEVRPLVTIAETIASVNEVRRLALLHTITDAGPEQDDLEARIAVLADDVESHIDRLGREIEDSAAMRELERLEEDWADYRTGLDTDLLPLSRAGRSRLAQKIARGQQSDRFVAVTGDLDDLTGRAERAASTELQAAQHDYATGRRGVIALLAAAALLGLGVALVLSRNVAGNVREVARAAQALARGDLDQRAGVRSGDETGALAEAFNDMARRLQEALETERQTTESLQAAVSRYSTLAARVAEGDLTVRLEPDGTRDLATLTDNLNGMVEGLRRLTGQVRDAAHGIGAAGSEIVAAATQHAAGAAQQSAAITEVAATVDELRASAEQTAQKAAEVAAEADRSTVLGEEGRTAVLAILDAMEEIRDKVGAIAQGILALSEQTQQIGDITSTVNGLADQSNLLALNASIEAAKAGEQGKGFAVVASEVRNLAEQSKEATAQVRGILGDIQRATNAAVLATEQGTAVVESGAGLAARAGEIIGDMTDTITRASQSVRQIAMAAGQQSAGVDQISRAMKDIGQATTQSAAGARQSQESAEALDRLAVSLQDTVDKYRVQR
ncbi:MAG: methyl-accepting chemotaxis protein [Actinomycetota bacterium]|nr:methyl-accepting chemotaxis protein [Actinomycetota bacterium]